MVSKIYLFGASFIFVRFTLNTSRASYLILQKKLDQMQQVCQFLIQQQKIYSWKHSKLWQNEKKIKQNIQWSKKNTVEISRYLFETSNNKKFEIKLQFISARWSWNNIFSNSRDFCHFFCQKVRNFHPFQGIASSKKGNSLLADQNSLNFLDFAKREFHFRGCNFLERGKILTFWQKMAEISWITENFISWSLGTYI